MSFVYRDVAMYIFFHYFVVFFFSYFIGISIIIREIHDSDWQHNRKEAEHNGCGVGNDNVGRQDHDDNEDGDKESKNLMIFLFGKNLAATTMMVGFCCIYTKALYYCCFSYYCCCCCSFIVSIAGNIVMFQFFWERCCDIYLVLGGT